MTAQYSEPDHQPRRVVDAIHWVFDNRECTVQRGNPWNRMPCGNEADYLAVIDGDVLDEPRNDHMCERCYQEWNDDDVEPRNRKPASG